MTLNYEKEPEFEKPVDVLLWTSRIYLAYAGNKRPIPDVVEATFEEARLEYFYEALCRVLDRLLISSTVDLTIHESTCPCTAYHEQALITALRALQHASREGYRVSMLSIVCPTAVRSAEQDMTIVAAGLADIERFWPGTTPSSASATKTPNHALGRLH